MDANRIKRALEIAPTDELMAEIGGKLRLVKVSTVVANATGGGGGGGDSTVSTYDAENKQGSTIGAGSAVATHSSGTGVVLASAANGSKPAVGLMSASTPDATSGTVQTDGVFALADWTAVIGAATLTRGPYYLDPSSPGMLTATAPSVVGQVVQAIGYAVSSTELDLSPATPILL